MAVGFLGAICVPVAVPPKVLVVIPGMVLAGDVVVASAGAKAFDIVFGILAVGSWGNAGGGTTFAFAAGAGLVATSVDAAVSALLSPEDPESRVTAGIVFSVTMAAVVAKDCCAPINPQTTAQIFRNFSKFMISPRTTKDQATSLAVTSSIPMPLMMSVRRMPNFSLTTTTSPKATSLSLT